jgi:hypothetical protein
MNEEDEHCDEDDALFWAHTTPNLVEVLWSRL